MAEEKKQEKKQETKIEDKVEKKKSGLIAKKEETGRIIRILQTDIPGSKTIYAGLTRIKGISWTISNAVCILSKMDKNKKVETLTKEEIQKLEEIIKNHKFPVFLLNRRKDYTSGQNMHLIGNDLDLYEELDFKRLKKIRSYRGLRHATGQPTRGQSTKSHFRANRKKGVGMKVKKTVEGGKNA
jgi:small subunit ribosomal protein S13